MFEQFHEFYKRLIFWEKFYFALGRQNFQFIFVVFVLNIDRYYCAWIKNKNKTDAEVGDEQTDVNAAHKEKSVLQAKLTKLAIQIGYVGLSLHVCLFGFQVVDNFSHVETSGRSNLVMAVSKIEAISPHKNKAGDRPRPIRENGPDPIF